MSLISNSVMMLYKNISLKIITLPAGKWHGFYFDTSFVCQLVNFLRFAESGLMQTHSQLNTQVRTSILVRTSTAIMLSLTLNLKTSHYTTSTKANAMKKKTYVRSHISLE